MRGTRLLPLGLLTPPCLAVPLLATGCLACLRGLLPDAGSASCWLAWESDSLCGSLACTSNPVSRVLLAVPLQLDQINDV